MGFHSYDVYQAAKHYNSWEKIQLDYGGDLDAGKFRSQAFGKGGKGSARPPLSDEGVALAIVAWYGDGEFGGAVEAYNNAVDAGGRTDRGGVLINFKDIAERLFLAQGDEVSAAQMRRGLEGLGIPASTRAVHVAELDAGFQRRTGSGMVE